jgi:hypothetical protein
MNILRIFIASYTSLLLFVQNAFAAPDGKKTVEINCYGLPGCADKKIEDPTP